MRICILQTLHLAFDKRVFQKEARSLARAGHDVLSMAPSDTPLPDEADGVRLERVPTSGTFVQRLINAARLIPRGLRAKPDVYLCIDPEAWVAGVLLKLLTGRKVVFDMHEYYPGDFANWFSREGRLHRAVIKLTTAAMRVLARITNHIILSKGCIDFVFEGLRVPRTVVLNTNHVQPMCTDIPAKLREEYGSRPTIIHEGDFGPIRGSYQLLKAMKILVKEVPDIRCIIIGHYTWGRVEDYVQAVREAGLEDHIHLLGIVPFQEVPAYVAVSRIGLILFQPSHGIGHRLIMPHKMFDYMREAKPFITTDYPVEIKRVVDETDCALVVDVSDHAAIAQGILHLLRRPEEAERLGRNGRRAVESKYNWGNDESELLRVFAAL